MICTLALIANLCAADAPTTAMTSAAQGMGAESAAYKQATAHDPRYDDAALWPGEAKKAAYARETWPKGRLLIWAKPGQSGRDGSDPAGWLENGQPATKTYDENTDLLLPAAEKRYWVTIQGRKYQAAPCRHVTIGKNAGLVWQHSARGNTWIKQGGTLQYLDSFVGDQHTFCRNDNAEKLDLVDHLYIKKTSGASVEFIGSFITDDELSILSGSMILGPGSEFGAGDRSDVTVRPEAQLVLLSGSYFHRRSSCDWGRDIVVSGKLLAGTPERPLTKDCRIGLGCKSKGVFQGTKRDGRMPGPDDCGLFVAPGGSLSVSSAAPKEARLILNCHRLKYDAAQVRILGDKTGLGAELLGKLETLPPKIDMVFLGKVELDGVLFDDVLKGGIMLPDLTIRSRWKNVFFGDKNEGKPDELFRVFVGKTGSRAGP